MRERAGRVLRLFRGSMEGSARGFANMLCALDLYLSAPREIAIAGAADDPRVEEFLKAIHETYLPDRVIVRIDPGSPQAREVAHRIPLAEGKGLVDGKAAAYVCRNQSCQKPVTSAEELGRLIHNP